MITEKPRVLIVDDRAENLLAFKEINANDYALIVMDVQMPAMDGFETVILIRSQNKTTNLPIIFLSAFYTDL